MKTSTIRIYFDDDARPSVVIETREGSAHARHIDEDLRGDVERWLTRGLIEVVRDEDGFLDQRITPATAPEFLERLKPYLERQFPSVRCEIQVQDSFSMAYRFTALRLANALSPPPSQSASLSFEPKTSARPVLVRRPSPDLPNPPWFLGAAEHG